MTTISYVSGLPRQFVDELNVNFTAMDGAIDLSLDGKAFTVPTLADLKALTSRPEAVIVETGQAAGVWQWEVGSTTTADDALVVNPTSGTAGRYKRIYVGALHSEWFGATFDGVTDDTTALTAFINAVMASDNRVGIMPAGIAVITSALPTINVAGVRLYGVGPSGLHDVSSLTGDVTVIKYTGAAGATMLTIKPDVGASEQRLEGIVLDGLTFDGNVLADKGVVIASIYGGTINITCSECVVAGLELGVVSQLGETTDLQNNVFRYRGRQFTAVNGVPLKLTGDSSSLPAAANVSLNRFEIVDIIHKNAVGIDVSEADNNSWGVVRVYCTGTATNSIVWRGGASYGTQNETFDHLTCTVAAIAKGTGTYTVPATNIRILSLDKGNGSPNPTVETGTSVYWSNDSSPFFPNDWTAWTPTVTATSGTITTVGALGMRYSRVGKTVFFKGFITITTNGTGAALVKFTLPPGINTISEAAQGYGRTLAVSGKQLQVNLPNADTAGYIANYDGSYPAVDGEILGIAGFYEIA